MTAGTAAQTHRRTGSLRAAVRLCACALLLSCTDPRGRPAPPIVRVSFAPAFQLTTPGTLLGSLYAFDEDGLNELTISVRSLGGVLMGDSTVSLFGEVEVTRQIQWHVPPNIVPGSLVTLAVTVTDFAGFQTSDTLRLTVQDSVSGGH